MAIWAESVASGAKSASWNKSALWERLLQFRGFTKYHHRLMVYNRLVLWFDSERSSVFFVVVHFKFGKRNTRDSPERLVFIVVSLLFLWSLERWSQ